MINWLILIVLFLLLIGIVHFRSGNQAQKWYQTIQTGPLSPPFWLSSLISGLFYLLLIYAWYIEQEQGNSQYNGLVIFLLLFHLSYVYTFWRGYFTTSLIFLSFTYLILVWLLVQLVEEAKQVLTPYASLFNFGLFLTFTVWTIFLTYINYYILLHNDDLPFEPKVEK